KFHADQCSPLPRSGLDVRALPVRDETEVWRESSSKRLRRHDRWHPRSRITNDPLLLGAIHKCLRQLRSPDDNRPRFPIPEAWAAFVGSALAGSAAPPLGRARDYGPMLLVPDFC